MRVFIADVGIGPLTVRAWNVIIVVAVSLAIASLRTVEAATYYVAPTGGSDSNSGAIGAPFATISHGVSVAHAGDTIYLRGGTFNLSSALSISTTHNGTAPSPVNLFAYPGDPTPVLDFRGETFSGNNMGAVGIDLQANYWHFNGFRVQYAADNGINVSGSNNTLERLVTRQNQDTGILLKQGSSRIPANNLILNCDSYGNFDHNDPTLSNKLQPGENADGFAAKFRDIGPGNYFIGDRSYNNADDGYDFWGASSGVRLIGCQAFHNGLSSVFRTPSGGSITGYAGDGNGFKLGHDSSTHTLSGNVAFGNPHNGFDVNGNALSLEYSEVTTHGVTLYNNTAFNNGTVSGVNYRFDEAFAHVLKNNISLSGTVNVNPAVVNDHNSWNSGFGAAASDFVSTTDPVTDGLFHPVGTGGDRDGTTSPTYPLVPGRDSATGNILNPTGFMQLKFGDHLVDVGTSSFNDATGAAVVLTGDPTVLNFTGVTVTIPGYSAAGPDLGAYEVRPLPGDFSRDGAVSAADISAMVAAMADLGAYQSQWSLTSADMLAIGDLDHDGKLTNADIQGLVNLLAGGGSGMFSAVPEPSSISLIAIGMAVLAVLGMRWRAGMGSRV